MPANKIANRPVLLTILMWVMLACTVGAAALLVHLKSGLWRIALTDPQTIGTVELRLPVGWEIGYEQQGRTESIDAIESGPPGRQLSVRVTHLDEEVGPMDFLLSSELVRLMTLESDDIQAAEKFTVLNGTGTIIHPKHGPSIAIITFTDGRVVTVQLASRSDESGSDDAIIYHVATSLRLNEEPEPKRGPRRHPVNDWEI